MRITLNTKNNIIIYTKKINFTLKEYDLLNAIKEYSLSQEEKKYILQKKNNSLRCQSLASITIAKQELHCLNNAKINQLELFYKYWTLKESYLKAIGIGLIDSITELNIGKLTFKNNILKREINNEMWNFYNTPFKEHYSLSLAFNKPMQNITFIDL